jgi:hypothetical protein
VSLCEFLCLIMRCVVGRCDCCGQRRCGLGWLSVCQGCLRQRCDRRCGVYAPWFRHSYWRRPEQSNVRRRIYFQCLESPHELQSSARPSKARVETLTVSLHWHTSSLHDCANGLRKIYRAIDMFFDCKSYFHQSYFHQSYFHQSYSRLVFPIH